MQLAVRPAAPPLAALAAAAGLGLLASWRSTGAVALVLAAAIVLLAASGLRAAPASLAVLMLGGSLALEAGARSSRLTGAAALGVLGVALLARGRGAILRSPLLGAAAAYGVWTLISQYWAGEPSAVRATAWAFAVSAAFMLALALTGRSQARAGDFGFALAVGSALYTAATLAGQWLAGDWATGDRDSYLAYAAVGLPLAVGLAVFDPRAQRRLLAGGSALALALAAGSARSGAGAAVLAGGLVAVALAGRRALALAVAVAAAAAIGVAAGGFSTVHRVQAELDPGGTSLWREALRTLRHHPANGLGAGGFDGIVHDAYLQTLAELGLVGVALLALVVLLAAWSLLAARRRAQAAADPGLAQTCLVVLGGLAGWAVSAVFLSNELGPPLWALAGVAVALDAASRGAAREAARVPAYDLDVRERLIEEREQRAAAQLEELTAELERLERRRRALVARGRELEALEHELEETEPGRAALAHGLASRAAELAEHETGIADRARALADHEREHEDRIRELGARESALAELERAFEERERDAAAMLTGHDAERAAEIERREREVADLLAGLGERERERAGAIDDLRRAAEAELAERERAIAERERELAVRAERLDDVVRSRAEELSRHVAEPADREEPAGPLAERARALDERARVLDETVRKRAAELGERAAALAEREAELERRAAEVTAEPEPVPVAAIEPEPLPEPLPEPVAAPAPVGPASGWNIHDLRLLVQDRRPEFPVERGEEWLYYIMYLSDFAAPDGRLPVEFEYLVWNVFGDLLRD